MVEKHKHIELFPETFNKAYINQGSSPDVINIVRNNLYTNLMDYGLSLDLNNGELELYNGDVLNDSLTQYLRFHNDNLSIIYTVSSRLIQKYHTNIILTCGGNYGLEHMGFDAYRAYLLQSIPSLELLEYYCSINDSIKIMFNELTEEEIQQLLLVKQWLSSGIFPEIIMLLEIFRIDIHNNYFTSEIFTDIVKINSKHLKRISDKLIERIIGVKTNLKNSIYDEKSGDNIKDILDKLLEAVSKEIEENDQENNNRLIANNLANLKRIQTYLEES